MSFIRIISLPWGNSDWIQTITYDVEENAVKQLNYSTTFLLLGSKTCTVCCIIWWCAPSLCYPSHSTFKTNARLLRILISVFNCEMLRSHQRYLQLSSAGCVKAWQAEQRSLRLFLAHITGPPSPASSWYREQDRGGGGHELILRVRLAAGDPAGRRDITQWLAAVRGSYQRGQMNKAE